MLTGWIAKGRALPTTVRSRQDRQDRIDRADRQRPGSPDDRQERQDRLDRIDRADRERSGSPDDRQERNDAERRAEREKVENTKDKDMGGPSKGRVDKAGRPASDPKHTGPQPILLDLDGNGVKVDDLSRSTVFVDAGGDGLKHRTAWAGAGDGVLFFDADGAAPSRKSGNMCSPHGTRPPIPTWRRCGPISTRTATGN